MKTLFFAVGTSKRVATACAVISAAVLHIASSTDTPRSSPASSPAEEGISDTAARLELARVLTYDKRYDEAIEAYRRVLAADPGNIEAKIGLTEVLYWTGKSEAAVAVLKGVPEDQLDENGKLLLADLLIARKEYDPALKIYTAYLERKPGDLLVRRKLADVQSWTKRYTEAIENYELILKERPEDRQIRRKYGLVLSWAGQKEKAAEQLRKSLDE